MSSHPTRVSLNHGVEMPVLGFGVYQIPGTSGLDTGGTLF